MDIRFSESLPPIFSLLHADNAGISIEVLSHLDAHRVRGIALTPTQRLACGMAVNDSGAPLLAPVGKTIRSRMFDVFGNAIDRGPALEDVKWQSVHKAPPPLTSRTTQAEIFLTGIKVIDVLVPLERGGQSRFVWWCRCGQKGEEFYREMNAAGVLPNMVMVFGQMNAPRQSLSSRARRAHHGRVFSR